jgi:hypothetical protein
MPGTCTVANFTPFEILPYCIKATIPKTFHLSQNFIYDTEEIWVSCYCDFFISCADSNLHPFKLNFIFGKRKVFVGDITPIGWLWKNWSSAWFQAFAAVDIKSAVFWDFTERRMVVPYRRFGTAFCPNFKDFLDWLILEDGTDRLSRIVGKKLLQYAA